MSEIKSIGLLFSEFQNGVQTATLKNYRNTLETGLEVLRLSSYDLPVLNDIFKYNEGFNDLCSKVESYLTTNVHFVYYRYVKKDNQLLEDFNLDISKYNVRSLLILIRCNYIANGAYSIPTRRLIEDFETIDRLKKTTSLEAIKKALPNVSTKYIEARLKDKNDIKRSGEVTKILLSLLYLLSYDHQAFTYKKSEGRTYNAFTSLNKVYRIHEMPFQLVELDIKSANPQIIDKIFNFDGRWKGVYSNLMSAYQIDRTESKILFNSTLNNHRLTVTTAYEIYLNAGYQKNEANQLAEATANQSKGAWFKLMANQEGEIMQNFIDANLKDSRYIRIHDALYIEPEFTIIQNSVELGIIEFGKSIIEKENLTLDLRVDSFKVVLSTPPTSEFVVKQYYEKSKAKQVLRTDNFTFYDRDFLQLSATFNISKPIISKDGSFRNPNENEFLERLMKLYKISMYLNNGNPEHFRTCIEHLSKHIQVSKSYIYTVLPSWQFDINDGLNYLKNRDWVYHGVSLSLSDFNSLYHKERREFVNKQNRTKLKADLIRLSDAVENNRLYHIDKNKYFSFRYYEVGKLIDMVHNLIGIKKSNTINEFNRNIQFPVKSYNKCNIAQQESVSKPLKPSINQRYKKKIDIFNKQKPTILLNLENAISNIDELQDITQLFTEQTHQKMNHKYKKVEPISAHEAFSEPIDYTHSVYSNHTSRSALLQGKEFYIGYCTHVRISEMMRNKLWENTNGFDSVKMLIQGQAIQLFNENYENVYAESMMSA